MNLQSYLEIMTAAERAKAFDAGQTNLDPTGVQLTQAAPKVKKMLPKKMLAMIMNDAARDYSFDEQYYRDQHEIFVALTDYDVISINKSKYPEDRMVVSYNGTMYSASVDDLIHEQIIGRMVYDGVIDIDANGLGNWYDHPLESMKNFITLQRSFYGITIYLGESYTEDGYNSLSDEFLIDFCTSDLYYHYANIIRGLGFKLEAEQFDRSK